MPSQLSKGTPAFNNYPGTNSQVTADLLNNLVDNGTILPGAISEQSSVAAATSDQVLIRRPGTNTLHRTTVDSILANTVFPVPVSVPIGSIVMWGAINPPNSNWLHCNGDPIVQATYPELFAIYGANLPDLRGMFIRGWDAGRGLDPTFNRQIRSRQEQDFKSHNHYVTTGGSTTTGYNASYVTSGAPYSNTVSNLAPIFTNNTGGEGADDETRPVNIALMFIVRAL
jgi:hypothetical protein